MTPPKNITPGPWKYHLGRGANPRLHIQTEGGYQIASTPEINRHPAAAIENEGRRVAAQLIAAAPQLAEALNALLNIVEISNSQYACPPWGPDLIKARAALLAAGYTE